MTNYKRLVQSRYLEFFSNKESKYMLEDDKHPPHYIGIAYEFMCEISSASLQVDYNDLYENVFKNEKWLYVDALEALTDDFIEGLTPVRIVTMLTAIRHKEIFCTGFFSLCGETGTIYRLLKQLKSKLDGKGDI